MMLEIVCYSKNKKLTELYPEFIHVQDEKSFERKESYILVLDKEVVKNEVEEFLIYMETFFTCKAIFILSSSPNFEEGTHLLTLGIKGYGHIYMQKIHMYEALESIEKGNIWLYPHFIQQMIQNFAHQNSFETKSNLLDLLSPREKEIADLITKGLSNKEIAMRLQITERTTKAHLTSIYEKLHVKDRVALVIKLSTKVQ
jgi:DNA-binding NarL/FixJ family response regulator